MASKVTDEGWRLFGERLNEAAETLNEARNLDEICPVYWSVMMRVALGLQMPKSKFDRVFNQAINAEPDYKGYYYHRATYYLPRWYGRQGEWENDLTQSADMTGGDEGDMLYALVVWDMNQWISFDNIFTESNLSWPRGKRGLELIERQYPDSLALENMAAHLAVQACDPKTARKYFDETNGRMDDCMWDSKNEFIRFANYAYTH